MTDAAGQQIYFLNIGKEYMLASVIPLPDSVRSDKTIEPDSLLNRYVQSVIQDATTLIYTNLEYKGLPAKFYKVRVDNEMNPISGLIADSYNLLFMDTIYSFSYLRYDATEMYDYNRQRKFFDQIEISKTDPKNDTTETFPSINTNQTHADSGQSHFFTPLIFALISLLLSVGGFVYIRRRNKN